MTAAQHNLVRYHNVSIILHWLMAALVILQLFTGWVFSDMERGPVRNLWFEWHRTLGFTVLFLTLVRLVWRFVCPPPSFPPELPRWEQITARINHILFYVLLIALPLTGWIYVSSGNTAATTGMTTLVGGTPWPIIPGLPREWHRLSADVHVVLVYMMSLLILLHVGAALKHQFIDKSRVANRMPPLGVRDKP